MSQAINTIKAAGTTVEVVTFPPAVFITACTDRANNHGVGAQNIYEAVGPAKAATGDKGRTFLLLKTDLTHWHFA